MKQEGSQQYRDRSLRSRLRAGKYRGILKRGVVRTSKGNPQVLDKSIGYKREEGLLTVFLLQKSI